MIKTGQSESKIAEPSGGKRSVACWNEDPQAQALRVELLTGNFFIFPLSHLLSAEFTRENEGDVLLVTFSTHEVKVRGRHLREVALALQKLAVEWIKEIAPKYARLAEPTAPLISSIEISASVEAQPDGNGKGST